MPEDLLLVEAPEEDDSDRDVPPEDDEALPNDDEDPPDDDEEPPAPGTAHAERTARLKTVGTRNLRMRVLKVWLP